MAKLERLTLRHRTLRRDDRRQARSRRDLASQFLRDVALELASIEEIGPGIVARACSKMQRQYLNAPSFTGHRGCAKHDW